MPKANTTTTPRAQRLHSREGVTQRQCCCRQRQTLLPRGNRCAGPGGGVQPCQDRFHAQARMSGSSTNASIRSGWQLPAHMATGFSERAERFQETRDRHPARTITHTSNHEEQNSPGRHPDPRFGRAVLRRILPQYIHVNEQPRDGQGGRSKHRTAWCMRVGPWGCHISRRGTK